MNIDSKGTLVILLLSIFAITSSCKNTSSDDANDFDRTEMLENYGQQIIIPSYSSFQDAVNELKTSVDGFVASPNQANLDAAQADLKAARLAWQEVNLFQFGPAESQALRTAINTYPVDADQVQANIDSGDYTLGTLANQAAAGFPTLGYLLHGVGDSDSEIILAYTSDSNASNRTTYLEDNVTFISDKIDAVVTEWSSNGGDYIAMFLSEENAGTDVGSSTGMLVNALIKHYERFLRDGKIGIPAGVRSAGIPRPSTTEAYYAGYSVELAEANIKAVEHFYIGWSTQSEMDGIGLKEHLQGLDADDLAAEIETELGEGTTAIQALSDPLQDQIENDNDSVLNAFQALQDAISLMKADMASVLGVTITFQDNDGD